MAQLTLAHQSAATRGVNRLPARLTLSTAEQVPLPLMTGTHGLHATSSTVKVGYLSSPVSTTTTNDWYTRPSCYVWYSDGRALVKPSKYHYY